MSFNIIYNNKERYKGIIEYEEEVEVKGKYKFRHIESGVYIAEEKYIMSKYDMDKLLMELPNTSIAYIELMGQAVQVIALKEYYSYIGNFVSRCKSIIDTRQDLTVLEYARGLKSKVLAEHGNTDETERSIVGYKEGSTGIIRVDDGAGYEVEEGIYYFPGNMIRDEKWGIRGYDTAGLYVTDTFDSMSMVLKYLAVGKEHFKELIELGRTLGGVYFMKHELNKYAPIKKKQDNKDKYNTVQLKMMLSDVTDERIDEKEVICNVEKRIRDGVCECEDTKRLNRNWESAEIRERREEMESKGAEEITEGIGLNGLDISLRQVYPVANIQRKRYDLVYKIGDIVHLDKFSNNGKYLYTHDEFDMKLLDRLVVFRRVNLGCGIEYTEPYKIIDNHLEKMKQLFTPVALNEVLKAEALEEENFNKMTSCWL